jgi:DNA-binding HxlR family transcriptional regulator
MPRKTGSGALPAPTTAKGRRQVVEACERWNALACPMPDPLPLNDFLRATDALIEWRNEFAPHLDVAPLRAFKEKLLALARRASPGAFILADAALEASAGEAIAAVHEMMTWLRRSDGVPTENAPPTKKSADAVSYVADEEDRRILAALAAWPNQLLTAENIRDTSRVSVKTVSERLRDMIEAGLVERPRGPKRGARITPRGLDLHTSLKPPPRRGGKTTG